MDIRQVERTVLDTEYKKFRLLHRPDDLTIFHLLKLFGDGYRILPKTDSFNFYMNRHIWFKDSIDGLGHCFRWISREPQHQIILPDSSPLTLNKDTAEFLKWGINYSKLFVAHVSWSRGLLSAQINEEKKEITFSYPNDFDKAFLATQYVAHYVLNKRSLNLIPLDQLNFGYIEWYKELVSQIIRGEFDINITKFKDTYDTVLSWLRTTIFPEIASNTDLKGYTLEDFRRFYAALYILSFYTSRIENDLSFLDSHIFALSKSDMILRLSKLCDIRPENVGEILENFIFDYSKDHSSLTVQPFVQSKKGNVFLLLRLLRLVNPSETLATALVKGKKQKIYDPIITSLEKANLEIISRKFSKAGYQILKPEKEIKNTSGAKITPDLIIYDKSFNKLLIIDYKHFLIPVNSSDVGSKIKEGRDQVRNYIKFIRNDKSSIEKLTGINKDNVEIYGVLLFRWPLAIPIEKDPLVHSVDWISLSNFLDQNANCGITYLINWLITRPDVSIDFEIEIESIKVADWTYQKPTLRGNNSRIV